MPYVVKFDSFIEIVFQKEQQIMRVEPEEVHDFEIIIRKTGKRNLINYKIVWIQLLFTFSLINNKCTILSI